MPIQVQHDIFPLSLVSVLLIVMLFASWISPPFATAAFNVSSSVTDVSSALAIPGSRVRRRGRATLQNFRFMSYLPKKRGLGNFIKARLRAQSQSIITELYSQVKSALRADFGKGDKKAACRAAGCFPAEENRHARCARRSLTGSAARRRQKGRGNAALTGSLCSIC